MFGHNTALEGRWRFAWLRSFSSFFARPHSSDFINFSSAYGAAADQTPETQVLPPSALEMVRSSTCFYNTTSDCQKDIAMMTSFDFKYQHAFRCDLCNVDLRHARGRLTKEIEISRAGRVKNKCPQNSSLPHIILGVKWRHRTNILFSKLTFNGKRLMERLLLFVWLTHHCVAGSGSLWCRTICRTLTRLLCATSL